MSTDLEVFYINGLITLIILIKAQYFNVISIFSLILIFFREIRLLSQKERFRKKVSYV